MAQVTVKACCSWASLLLLLLVRNADGHEATDQHTSNQPITGDNELQDSFTLTTDKLNQVMEKPSATQQENSRISQRVIEIRRHQEESDDFESGFNYLKTFLRYISASKALINFLTSFEQLTQHKKHLKTTFQATSSAVTQQSLQKLSTTTETLNELEQNSNHTKPRDCGDILSHGSTSTGAYTVYTGSTFRPLSVYCDMTTENGGWTVFQRRQDGSENFYRNWVDYASGFGDLYREFWLGNDNIYSLSTNDKRYELRIDLEDFNGTKRYAEYSDFKLGSSSEKYKLVSLGAYSGNAGDSLSYHIGSKFSTIDQDNDNKEDNSCAFLYKGAWWYNHCHLSNLNGYYYGGQHESYADGVNWHNWTGGYHYSLRFTEMKFRQSSHHR